MKVAICFAVFIFLYNFSHAQVDQTGYQEHGEYLDVYDNTGHKVNVNNNSNLSGSPMLNREWGNGSVAFDNGKQISNIFLQFNIKNNTLLFKKDSVAYAFADKVRAFKMTYNDNGLQKSVLFRSGYPDRHGNATNLLYEVINEGPNIQFLKWLQCNINEHYVYGLPAIENYTTTQEYYLYLVKRNQLIKISENKKSVLNALSDYKDQAEKFIANNNSRLDNDKEISDLVTSLNYVQ